MAQYQGIYRTNYFAVTDVEKFEAILNSLSSEGVIEHYEHDTEKGKYMFFCDYNLIGYEDDDSDEGPFDAMLVKLQTIIPDNEALILTEIGNEKMRYFHAVATIITSQEIQQVNLADCALDKAKEMLGNLDYTTHVEG